MITVAPRLGELVTRVTQTPDIEAALWKILSEYVDLKTSMLRASIARFEQKWGMTFDEFSRGLREGTLNQNIYSWETEQDYWKWEESVTLLKHYENLRF